MNKILRRRRSLMAKQGDPSVLWHISNYDSGDPIDTKIKLMDTDRDFSIAYDINIDSNPSSGDSSAFRLVSLTNEAGTSFSLCYIKYSATSTSYSFYFCGNHPSGGFGSISTGRLRFVITHSAGSGSATIKIRIKSGSVSTSTQNATFAPTSKTLRIGGNGTLRLPSGTLNKAVVYNRVLSSDEINELLGVS